VCTGRPIRDDPDMARNREIRLNYVGAFLGLPTSSATTFRITRTRHSPSLQQGRSQLRESTKRAIMTHPNHDQKPARLDTDASLFSAAAIPLNKDASQQYVTSTHANERELLAVVEAPQVWCHRLEVAPSYCISEATDRMIMPPTSSPTNEIAASTAGQKCYRHTPWCGDTCP